MGDVRGDFLGPPHGTTPVAVIANKKLKLRSLKSSEHINEKAFIVYMFSCLLVWLYFEAKSSSKLFNSVIIFLKHILDAMTFPCWVEVQ